MMHRLAGFSGAYPLGFPGPGGYPAVQGGSQLEQGIGEAGGLPDDEYIAKIEAGPRPDVGLDVNPGGAQDFGSPWRFREGHPRPHECHADSGSTHGLGPGRSFTAADVEY